MFIAGTMRTGGGAPVRFMIDPAILPGAEDSYQSYGVPWANLSNTPFREYKHWVHERRIATPLIVHWPERVKDGGELRHQLGQLTDIMATCLDAAGAAYPETYGGNAIRSRSKGASSRPSSTTNRTASRTLVWEHEGNRAVRRSNWKLVCKYPGDWELYGMVANRTETDDLAAQHPQVVAELSAIYDAWAERSRVEPWDRMLGIMRDKARARRG